MRGWSPWHDRVEYSPEVRERAVRMVREHGPEHPSQWAAIASIAEQAGMHGRDAAPVGAAGRARHRPPQGLTTDERQRLKELERENRELKRANEILRKASAYFAQAELDRRREVMVGFIDEHRDAVRGRADLRRRADRPVDVLSPQGAAAGSDPRGRRGRGAMTSCASRFSASGTRNFQVYGPRKVWRQLRREGIGVARCTRRAADARDGLALAPCAAARGSRPRSRGHGRDRPPDLVDRQFTATRPESALGRRTSPTSRRGAGFVYVAFVIDVFARRIVGWRVSASLRTDFVLDALEQAIYAPLRRRRSTGLVHHSDRGTQYLSMRYTDRLADAGIAPSVGSRGDSYDNALAESVIGLFKTEVIRRTGTVAPSGGGGVRDARRGSTGSTRGGCSSRSATCRRPSTKRGTMHSRQGVALAGIHIPTPL